MKKLVLVAALAAFSVQSFAKEVEATATWQASAKKDTTTTLVVTASNALHFDYQGSTEAFSDAKGNFDVSIDGLKGATEFKLTTEVLSDQLTRGTDTSALTVGVDFNGQPLAKGTPFTLLDTSANINGGLTNIMNGYNVDGTRASDRSSFIFKVASAADSTGNVAFSKLPDGYWDGQVAVRFLATWTTGTP
ncbi:common pilus major fimbrillin subunit EcpA [Acinetobacter pullicarnis]|uniref:common pilus major fimbrillin subunit EcpA n=1 Tax=Acinetobacter pullicarnis TaxID=2576829 RepID=UPI001122D2F7|nr:common pilus major fimbrillin subunit EcpA [Acinetobacter pullicarnis]